MNAVEIKEMTKDFSLPERGRYVRAVDGLSLAIEEGCVFGLLGPNGSGKSTTIKVLLGLSAASAGACSVFGEAAGSLAARKRVGYLPDAPYFYRYLSGLELMRFYGKLLGLPKQKREEQSLSLLEEFGILDAADRKVGAYSKGMLQRLGFAQALLGDPDLLVLDEPTAGVDPVGAAEVGEYILALKKKGKTVLLCSHLLTQVQSVCDRIGILNKGRLLAEGSVEDLLTSEHRDSVRIEGLSPEGRRRIDAIANEDQARIRPDDQSLEGLFRELVERDAAVDSK